MRVLAFVAVLCVVATSGADAQIGPIINPMVMKQPSVVPIGTPTSIGTNTANSGGTTIAITTTANIAAGNLVFVATCVQHDAGITVTGVSDGTNTYTRAITQDSSGAIPQGGDIWYKANATAVAAGATLTVTYSGTTLYGKAVAAGQVSGISTSSTLDKTNAGPGTAVTNPTVSTGVLSYSNEIVVGAFCTQSTITADSSFTTLSSIVNGNGFAQLLLSTKTVSSTNSVTFAPTQASAAIQALVAATFRGN